MGPRFSGLVVFLILGTQLSFATLYTDPSQLPRKDYDYIIVGGEYAVISTDVPGLTVFQRVPVELLLPTVCPRIPRPRSCSLRPVQSE